MHHIRSRKSRAGDENSHEIYVEISVAGSPSSSCAGDDVVDRLRRSDVIVHVTSPGDVCSSTIRFSSCLIAFFTAGRYAIAVYAVVVCPSVRLSQTCIVSKHQLDESSWGLVWMLPFIHPRLCYKEIWVSPNINVLPSGILFQTLT